MHILQCRSCIYVNYEQLKRKMSKIRILIKQENLFYIYCSISMGRMHELFNYMCVHWLARPDFLYPYWDSRIQSCKLYPFGNVFSVLKIVTKFCLKGPYIAIEIGGHRSLWCMGLDSLQCPVYWREPWTRHVSRVFDLVFVRFFLGRTRIDVSCPWLPSVRSSSLIYKTCLWKMYKRNSLIEWTK